MRWYDLLFAHWPVTVDGVRRLIPPALEVDTWDGMAWIGIVPFRMSGIALRGLPDLPYMSAFDELNVRTYVTIDDKPGVWFFSLDATNPIAVQIARWTFHLPYANAQIQVQHDGGRLDYSSQRKGTSPGGRLHVCYGPAGPMQPAPTGTLAAWLTERYCLYASDRRRRIYRGEIDHAPWPLQPAEAEFRYNTMLDGWGIELPPQPTLLHFAQRLDVVVWTLDRVCP